MIGATLHLNVNSIGSETATGIPLGAHGRKPPLPLLTRQTNGDCNGRQ